PYVGLRAAHQRVVLGAFVDAALAAHAGSVDEADRPLVGLDHGVDAVARGSWYVVDHGPVVADEAIEQGRFADVGPAHDGDGRNVRLDGLRRLVGFRLRLGQTVDHGVEEIARAPAVQGADDNGVAQAEAGEGPGVGFSVALV